MFSVLLGTDSGGSWEVDLGSSDNPERPTSILIDVPLSALTSPLLLTLTYDMKLPPDVLAPTSGYVFDLTLSDPETGEFITRFSEPIKIQLAYPAGSPQADPAGKVLSYLDGSAKPPVWLTEDAALTQEDGSGGSIYRCGKTSLLTTFFMGAASAVPEPASGLMILAGAGLMLRRREAAVQR